MFKVDLYRRNGNSLQIAGTVEFSQILITSSRDYRCIPQEILTHAEVVELSKSLCHLPAIYSGKIGEYEWFEVAAPGRHEP